MTTDKLPAPTEPKTWRRRAAEQIVIYLACGPSAYRDIGIEPIETIEKLLYRLHPCVQDPIDESKVLRGGSDDE